MSSGVLGSTERDGQRDTFDACSYSEQPNPPVQVHNSLVQEFKYALVWGTSSKHYPQR